MKPSVADRTMILAGTALAGIVLLTALLQCQAEQLQRSIACFKVG